MGDEKVAYDAVPKAEDDTTITVKPKGLGVRHTQVFILFTSLTVAYMLRAQMSVSMVAMTEKLDSNKTCIRNNTSEIVKDFNNSTGEFNDFSTNQVNISENVMENNDIGCEDEVKSKWNVYRTYDWNKSTQEMIQWSFFAGYVTMQIPMGCIAQKFGGKYPLVFSLALNGFTSIIMPWLPIIGWFALGLVRVIQGMTQAAFYPSIHTLLGKWAPLSERTSFGSFVYTGSQFGIIVIFQISGIFAGTPALGWPATFWFCGVLSLFACGLLTWLGSSSPHEHPTITAEEMTFIMKGGCADESSKTRKTPWMQIIKSKAVWGLFSTHIGYAMGYLLLLTQIPSYMSHVLKVDITKNGLYSSLPYIAMYFSSNGFGVLADFVVNRKMLSIANIRRITNSIGMIGGSLLLIAFSYLTTTIPAVIMLIAMMTLYSGAFAGFHRGNATCMIGTVGYQFGGGSFVVLCVVLVMIVKVNQIDLSPNFAGSIMAIGNTVAVLFSLLVPVIVSCIIKDDMTNQTRWQIVFLIFAVIQIVTNTIYVIFVKGTVQPWNSYDECNDDEKTNSEIVLTDKKNPEVIISK